MPNDKATVIPANSFGAKNRSELRRWLTKNHENTKGVWLISYKKQAGKLYLPYDAIVEEVLCFGWIDSKPNKLDELRSMLWLAPRKPGTGWSKLNKERIERMTALGKMTPAGLEKIQAAKKDGSWSALDAVEKLIFPADLIAELAKYAHAGQFFEAFPRSTKRGILEWIQNAKTEATRQKRISNTAELAEKNIRANQWRPK